MPVEIRVTCDCCGGQVDPSSGHGAWQIELWFKSMWRQPDGHKRAILLCSGCGSRAANLLGFCYDTGTILSMARGEMVDSAEVHGPNGGGLADIAMNGVGGGHGYHVAREIPRSASGCSYGQDAMRIVKDDTMRIPVGEGVKP